MAGELCKKSNIIHTFIICRVWLNGPWVNSATKHRYSQVSVKIWIVIPDTEFMLFDIDMKPLDRFWQIICFLYRHHMILINPGMMKSPAAIFHHWHSNLFLSAWKMINSPHGDFVLSLEASKTISFWQTLYYNQQRCDLSQSMPSRVGWSW